MSEKIEKNELEFEGFNYRGFKLIKLKLIDSKLFGNIEYDFVDAKDLQDKIYSTVIIGPNGTRKSLLLRLIIFMFKSIGDLKENNLIEYEKFSIFSSGLCIMTYSLNHNIYEFRRGSLVIKKNDERHSYGLKINNKDGVKIEDFELPLSIVANSINLTDKFPIYKKKEFQRYEYLGVKTSPQAASTKSYLRKIIGIVANLSQHESFLIGINAMAKNFIGNKDICFTYKTSQFKKFFHGELDLRSLTSYFDEIEIEYQKKQQIAPFKLGNFRSLQKNKPEELEKLIEYINQIKFKNNLLDNKKGTNPILKFNLANVSELNLLKKENEFINQLYAIGLLTDIKIEFQEENFENYSIEESSSGEYNLITSFIGMIATVKTDSIVLIDEPEISLHPNWQMKYISFLKDVFNHEIYSTSHIIIASHSHFIVSDLEGDNSKIIGLTKNDTKIEIVPFEKNLNTFGWSVEDILWNVFQVPTSRNYYLANMVGDVLKILSKENITDDEIKAIKGKKGELLNIKNQLKEIDPLRKVLDIVLEKI